ncbi:tyrosine--tRNA ligase [Patescibacteria group bacterium]|nr:tyrosine--tRNA ligase [Patescibacteria group bacterium]MBU1921673.1 tyrosine--tRNA ligase [Patescibacteria group bacterium]
MKAKTDKKKIDEILTRTVENIYPSREALEKVLHAGKRLKIYTGIDPTGPEIHLGHAVFLRKLRQFQDLGHEIILLIGDFTGMVGDPTGKYSTRQVLTDKEIKKNEKDYKKQVGKILDFKSRTNPAKVMKNSAWLSKLKFKDILELCSNVTVQQMIERDMFEKRIKTGKPISLHEFLYPIMQGYDSVAMNIDMEVGGSDQTFNMLVGRDLMKSLKKKEKFVLTTTLLTDASGRKIGKTEGNVIAISDKPEELYGKIMALGDEVILKMFAYCTDVSKEEIKGMAQKMSQGANPRDYKMQLAHEIVRLYNGAAAAKKAEQHFKGLFQEKAAPSKVKVYKVADKKINIVDLLIKTKLASSKSDARRLIEQGGVKADGHVLEGWDVDIIPTKKGAVVQKGKRHFIKIIKK